MRCLTLAKALGEKGATTRFICRALPGDLIELLQQQGIPVSVLQATRKSVASSVAGTYADWLGVTQEEDAAQTLAALRGERPDWLIVDHYALDKDWERRLQPQATKLMVIDDLAGRSHECALLFDQNDLGNGPAPQSTSSGVRIAGPRYALLRPEYRQYREGLRARDGRVNRVLIFFGGTDPHDMTGMALEALSAPDFSHLEVDVVIGANNPHRARLEDQIRARPRTAAHGPRVHLADLMARADLAIGAGGTTTWERLCLGLPSVVVSIADNQEPGCRALSNARLVRYLGDHKEVQPAAIAAALTEWMGNSEALADLSLRSQLTVDGLGTLRVAEYLDPTTVDSLRLRPAVAADLLLYFDWVNDPDVRQQALHTDEITLAGHRKWFATRLASAESRLFVMCAGELPVGQIRFDRDGGEARIDYSVDPLFRGRGWGRKLVALGMERMQSREPIVFRADVKERNLASRAVFAHLGYVEATSSSGGLVTYSFDPSVHGVARAN